jgi:hypothetical protein
MTSKFTDVYRSSFITLDRNLQQTNSTQLYFRQLLPPLNTVSGDFFSLSPAQGSDPTIRLNKYDADGTFLGYGYLYDTSFNVPGEGPTGPTGPTGPIGPTGLPGSATNTGATGPPGILSVEGTGYGNLVIYDTTAGPTGSVVYSSSIEVDASGHLLPTTSYTYDLGSTGAHWRDLYLSEGTIYLGPTGTIGGDETGSVLLNATNGRVVGIGTTTPNKQLGISLDVSGGAYFGVSGEGSARIVAQSGTTYFETGRSKALGTNNTLVIGSIGATAQVMRIDTSEERVGVNGVPAFPLHVITSNTNSASRQIVASADAAGQFYTYLSAISGPSAYYGSFGARRDDVPGGLDLYINPTPFSGNVGVGYLNGATLPGSKLNVNGNVTISGDCLPAVDGAFDLGSPSQKWRSLYLSGASLFLGTNTKISSTATGPMNMTFINAGLTISNGTNTGTVYDSYFNPPEPVAQSRIPVFYNAVSAGQSPITLPFFPNDITTNGNYLIQVEITIFNGLDSPAFITINENGSAVVNFIVPPFTIPGSLPEQTTTYTATYPFSTIYAHSVTINNQFNTLGSLQVQVYVLFLSP